MGTIIIKKRVNGDFQFNLKAGNGEVILTSQGYSSKQGCESGIALLMRFTSSIVIGFFLVIALWLLG